MKIKLLISLAVLSISQMVFAAGISDSSKSQAGSVYVIEPGVIKKNPECDLIDPVLVYERLSKVVNTNYICFSGNNEYYAYIARDSNETVEVEIGLEDNFDGTWYGYVFEYKLEAENALPSAIYRYDLTLEQVQSCRAAFEPPFVCESP